MHEPRGFVKKENDCSSISNYTRLIIWLHINNILQWKRRDVKLHAQNDRQFFWAISHFTEFCFLDIDDHAFSWPQFFVLLCVIWKLHFFYCKRNSICYMGVSMGNPWFVVLFGTQEKKNFASGIWNRNDSDYFLLMTFVWNLAREMYKTYIRFPKSGSIFRS